MIFSGGPIRGMTALRRRARLEHRLTRPDASLADLDAAVGLALEYRLAGLAVSPWLVRRAARSLARTAVRVGTVIGFPHGGQVTATKAFEASKALEDGATQLDFVLNAGALASGDEEAVLNDMLAVVEMAHSGLAVAGVIVTGDDALLRRACRLAARAGVDYLVTSTGDASASAAIARTALVARLVDGGLAVKAAGAFTELSELGDAVEAGAEQISTTFSAELARELAAWLDGPVAAAPALADVGAAAG